MDLNAEHTEEENAVSQEIMKDLAAMSRKYTANGRVFFSCIIFGAASVAYESGFSEDDYANMAIASYRHAKDMTRKANKEG